MNTVDQGSNSNTDKNSQAPIVAKTADEWKQEGNQFYNLQNYQKAIQAYTKAIQLNPNQPNYYNNRAACNMIFKNYKQVISDSEKALAIDAKSAKGYRRKGLACMNLGRFEEAILNLKQYLDFQKDVNIQKDYQQTMAAKNSYDEALLCLQNNKYDEALKHITLVEKRTTNPQIVKIKCEIEAKIGHIDAANFSLKKIEDQITKVELLYLKALIDLNTFGSNRAVKYLNQAIQIDSSNLKIKSELQTIQLAEELYEIGNQHLVKQQYEDAIKSFESALSKSKSNRIFNSKIHFKIAKCMIEKDCSQQALQNLNTSLQLNSSNLQSYYQRIKLFVRNKQYQKALTDYKKLQEKDPNTNYKQNIQRLIKKKQAKKTLSCQQMLDVSKDSSIEEIKKAYQKIAINKYNTSQTNTTGNNEYSFFQISRAYQTLINADMRQSSERNKEQYETQEVVTSKEYLSNIVHSASQQFLQVLKAHNLDYCTPFKHNQ